MMITETDKANKRIVIETMATENIANNYSDDEEIEFFEPEEFNAIMRMNIKPKKLPYPIVRTVAVGMCHSKMKEIVFVPVPSNRRKVYPKGHNKLERK